MILQILDPCHVTKTSLYANQKKSGQCVYVNKIKEFLSDTSKFQLISEQMDKFACKIKDKLTNLIHKIKGMADIPENTLKYLTASGSSPGILYGLPKIHT